MDAKLVVVRGADRIEIDLFLPFLIGRSADAALKIPHESVSREHCRIYEFDGELAVRDLGSRNGTFVNGQKIDKPTFLSPDDELTVGGITFQANYQIRRQVVVTPLEEEPGASTTASSETIAEQQQSERAIEQTSAETCEGNSVPKTTKTSSKQPVKERVTKQLGRSIVVETDIPTLESPPPTVTDIPELKTTDAPAPNAEQVDLQTEATVEPVCEDELKDFLSDLG